MPSNWNFLDAQYGLDGALIPIGPAANASESTLALNAAYVYGSAGVGILLASFFCKEAANLTNFIFKVKSYTGTWGSTDGKIQLTIHEGINGSNIPGTTITATANLTLDGTTTGLLEITGLSIPLAAGKFYTIVLSDSDGSASNFVTVVYRYTTLTNPVASLSAVASTTNGFSSAGTAISGVPVVAFKIGSDWYSGQAFDTIATTTSGVYDRGVRFKPDENVTIAGACASQDSTLLWGSGTVKLYDDVTAAGGTALAAWTLANQALSGTQPSPTVLPFTTASRYDLKAGVWYLFTFTPGSALSVPRKCTISGSPSANALKAFLPMGGNCHWVDSSTGSWDKTQTNSLPCFGPLLIPTTATNGALTTSY